MRRYARTRIKVLFRNIAYRLILFTFALFSFHHAAEFWTRTTLIFSSRNYIHSQLMLTQLMSKYLRFILEIWQLQFVCQNRSRVIAAWRETSMKHGRPPLTSVALNTRLSCAHILVHVCQTLGEKYMVDPMSVQTSEFHARAMSHFGVGIQKALSYKRTKSAD